MGKPLNRRDGVEKVTGRAQYAGDIKFPGMLYGKILYSPHLRARIAPVAWNQKQIVDGTALLVFAAVLGTLLLRQQGFATLRRLQATQARGQIPAMELLEGVLLTLSGILLLIPGFFTDALGYLGLIPPLRRWLVRSIQDRYFLNQDWPPQAGPPPGDGPVTLEGEFRREDD